MQHLGNVVGLTGGSNEVVNRYVYTPWGELEERTSNTYDPLGFTARERDDETGLYHYRARYYDPQLGRFLSEDPIGLEGGINPYAYVGNNPVNFRDPSGLCVGEKHTSETTCEHDRITVVAPPPSPAPDPCARGACWNRGIGGTGGTGGTGGRGSGGPTVGARTRPTYHSPSRRQCVAASAAAVVATAEDLATFAGVGLVLKGARGAQAGVKLATVGRFLAAERLGATHAGTEVTSRHIMNSSGAMLGGIGWGATTSATAGQDFGLFQIATGLIPGVNMGMALWDAYQVCSK